MVISFIRLPVRKDVDMIMIFIKITILSSQRVVTVIDLRYHHMETDFPDQLSSLPYKNKINQYLSQEEKNYNKNDSKKRIIVEHTICRLKKYRIMSEV